MATIINGTALAASVRADVAARAAQFAASQGRPPGLAAVLVGDDPASRIYVRNKERAAREVGFHSETHHLAASVTEAEVLDLVRALNSDERVDGILVQLPVPPQVNAERVIEAIDPAKDVDGLHPLSRGRLLAGEPGLRPCTPLGCMRLLEHAGVELRGAQAVVVGRSLLVGKPLALMLLERHATVTVCHSRTADLAAEISRAEVLVAAVGRPALVQGAWVRVGAVVIDVGVNRLADGKLVGDVDFEGAQSRARAITPVPGGVGPMTIACLLENTLRAARSRAGFPLDG
jgi:methylenetetrahydrofolate dehydrogenase (NADP+)/methenyltetrahydrofolate cyclohydrolase